MRSFVERLGSVEFDRCSIPFVWWWTAGLESSAAVSRSLVTVVAGPLSCGTCVRGNAGGAVVWNPLERGGSPSCCNCVLQNEVA